MTTRRGGIASLPRLVTVCSVVMRPTGPGRLLIALPLVSYAVATAMVLLVVGGTAMFMRHADGEFGYLYSTGSLLALVLLLVPIATLGAASARLSGRIRNDRLAVLRLLGVTARQARMISTLESTVVSLIGSLLGVALWVTLLPVVGLLSFFGAPIGAYALWPGLHWVVISVGAITVIGTCSSILTLRQVSATPLGLVRRVDPAPAGTSAILVAGIMFAAVVLIIGGFPLLGELAGPAIASGALFAAFSGALAVVNLLGSPLIALRGRQLARKAKTASELIAGSQLAEHSRVVWRRVSVASMTSLIAVVAGVGVSITTLVGEEEGQPVFRDLRTGVIVTLILSFIVVACSTAVSQVASTVEDRPLLRGLDRIGMPASMMAQARRTIVMMPLRWAILSGTCLGLIVTLPFAGVILLVQPIAILTIAGSLVTGYCLVWVALAASNLLVSRLLLS